MAEKNNTYETIVDVLSNSGLTDDEIKKYMPNVWTWWNSASDEDSRKESLNGLLGQKSFQDELVNFNAFSDFNFSPYEGADVELPSGMEDADMESVRRWYGKAQKAVDPQGTMGKKPELYKTNREFGSSESFEWLEDSRGEDYSGDWVESLMQELGYPDTPEGYDQLVEDWNSVMSRMKWSEQEKKYGGPVEFLMGNSTNTMKDGKKPTLGDVVSDVISNIAWMIPGGQWVKLAPKAARLAQASQAMARGKNNFNVGLRAGTKLVENGSAPAVNEVAKALLATKTSDGSNDASVTNAVINTGVNGMIMPILKRFVTGRPGAILESTLGMKPGEFDELVYDKALNKLNENAPWLVSYAINRLGNDGVAKIVRDQFTRGTDRVYGEDEK